jgi:hypothetical protein
LDPRIVGAGAALNSHLPAHRGITPPSETADFHMTVLSGHLPIYRRDTRSPETTDLNMTALNGHVRTIV